jgi:hypothetical protein
MQGRPMFVRCCHCKDCQRQTGTGFVLNALIEADRVATLSGDPRPYAMPTDSGRPHTVFRCPDCGTAVWSEYGGLTKLRFVRVGTLDDPAALPPDVHIYTRSKLPWIALPEGVPAFEAYYSSRDLWPAESLDGARRCLVSLVRHPSQCAALRRLCGFRLAFLARRSLPGGGTLRSGALCRRWFVRRHVEAEHRRQIVSLQHLPGCRTRLCRGNCLVDSGYQILLIDRAQPEQ